MSTHCYIRDRLKSTHTTSPSPKRNKPRKQRAPRKQPPSTASDRRCRRRRRRRRRKNISCLSRLDHDRMAGMLLHEANRCLSSGAPNDVRGGGGTRRRRPLLGPADIRGVCVWGNHSNSQVRVRSLLVLELGVWNDEKGGVHLHVTIRILEERQ